MRYEIHSFNFANLDEELVEMFLMSISQSSIDTPIAVVDYTTFSDVNGHLSINTDPWAKGINPGDAAKRMIQDDLPGYYLDVHNGAGDDDSKILRKRIRRNSPSGTTASFYFQKPGMLAEGLTHTIEILGKYFRTEATQRAFTRDSNYQIEVTKVGSNIQFRVKRNGGAVGDLDIDKPLPTGTNFLYFTIQYGSGILYFTSSSNCRAKTYETLPVYEVGHPVLKAYSTFGHDAAISDIIGDDRLTTTSKFIYTTVEYKPPGGVTTNVAVFKVLELNLSEGVIPAFLVADTGSYPDRCYYPSVRDVPGRKRCMALAHLSNPSEPQTLDLIDSSALLKTSSGAVNSICKVIYRLNKCLSPILPGHITNLEVKLRYPLPNGGNMALADYNSITDQETKDFFIELTSNLGTKYLVGCPETCRNLFSFVFLKYSKIQFC